MNYRCWCPDMGEGPDDGETIDGLGVFRGHEQAAESYVEKNFSDWSYPRECDVMVQAEDGAEAVAVHVEVESVPSFYGSRKR